jgi:hypothetical protein
MNEDPISDLEEHLEEDEQLFLLPLTGVDPEAAMKVSSKAKLYAKATIDYHSLRIVSYPAYELYGFLRRSNFEETKSITVRGMDKSWLASAMTQVTLDEFFACPILAFPFKVDMDKFLCAHSHVTHMLMMKAAVEAARTHWEKMNPKRLHQAESVNFCTLPDSVFSAAMLYSPYYDESYIFAGKIEDATLLKEPEVDTGEFTLTFLTI